MTDGVEKQSPEIIAMAEPWPMIDALVSGTAAMRASGEAFMPRWPAEEPASYAARLKTATLFPAFSRTCAVLGAKPFSRPLTYKEGTLPESIMALTDDVDMFGTDMQPFLAGLFRQCLQSGLLGVLVDCPPAVNVNTKSDEKSAGIRPYFAVYQGSSILGWKAKRDSNGSHLTQLRLMESFQEPDGRFNVKMVPQIRVLEPGRWEIFRKNADQKWISFQSGVTSLDVIPFVFYYGIRQGFGIGAPPLLDLAYLNVEHWQSASDQQTILHVARIPVLFAKAFGANDKILIGAATAATASSADADLRYVEHSGAAVESGRQSLLDLEDRMRQTGAELLVKKPNANTATQVRDDASANKSTIEKIIEDFEESTEDCLKLLGRWINQPCEPEVSLFKDFGTEGISGPNADVLLRAVENQVVSRETAFNEFKRLDLIRPDADWKIEAGAIAAQPPAPGVADKMNQE